MNPTNNRGLHQGVLHFWSKFGDSSLNELSRRPDCDWHTHTDRQTQATTIPKGQNWPKVTRSHNHLIFIYNGTSYTGKIVSDIETAPNLIFKQKLDVFVLIDKHLISAKIATNFAINLSSLVEVMACHLFGPKPSAELNHYNSNHQGKNWNLHQKYKLFSEKKGIWTCHALLKMLYYFVSLSMCSFIEAEWRKYASVN